MGLVWGEEGLCCCCWWCRCPSHVIMCESVWLCMILYDYVWIVRHYCMRHTICASHGSWHMPHYTTECMHKSWRIHDDACGTTHDSCKLMRTHNFCHVIMHGSHVIVIMNNHMTIILVMWLCRTDESLWLWMIHT